MSLNRGAENGSRADAAVVTDAAGTVHGKLRGLVKWAFERMPAALGQTTMAASLPVTLASNQSAVAVSPTALVAGTANIGDVDVLTVPAPLSTTGTGTEATALRVTVATDSTGVLSVDDNGASLTVDGSVTANAGTNLNTSALALEAGGNLAGAASSLDLLDDAVVADDAAFTPATTKVMMAGFEFDDSSPDSVNEGDAGAARMSANRNQYSTIRDAAGNERGVNVSAGNALIVDGSAATQPVSGTVTANLAAGTNNIGDVDVASIAAGDNNIGNVDIVTMPTVTVNSHAVTNAGTFGIQDSQKVADNAGFTDGTTPVQPAGLIFDEVAGTALTENDIGAARMDSKRAAVSVIEDETTRGRRTTVTAANALKVDGSAVTQPVSVASLPSQAVTNAGTFATQIDGAALTALQLIDDPVIADDAAFTPATTKVMMVGLQADETSTDSVDEGDGGAARMTLDRKAIVTVQPHSSGGCSIYRSIDLDEGTLEVVKNSPGTLYGMWVTNTATATRFIKFYDATSGTAGTGTPVITIGIPGNTSDDVAGAFGPAGVGIAFATGICFGATTAAADADTGAPGAGDVIANVFYK